MKAIKINKWLKLSIAFSSDLFMTLLSYLGGCWLTSKWLETAVDFKLIVAIIVIQSICYFMCGLYRGIWRFASIPDLLRIIKAISIATIINILLLDFSRIHVEIQTLLICALLNITFLSSTRIVYRIVRDYRLSISQGRRVLVVGAGSAGEGIIRNLVRSQSTYQYKPVAIVDDNKNKHGSEVHGIRVIGSCKDIPNIVAKHHIKLILIAIPSADSKRMREIVTYCELSNIPFKTLPSVKDIADGTVTMNALREVLLDDLLGREQVDLEWNAINNSVMNKTVLVTGGGGSIGSELCRQLSRLSPAKLIIVDNNEYNLYAIEMELTTRHPHLMLYPHLSDVTDKSDLEKIFDGYKPDLVFHVAAYKHVPLLEKNIRASMHNNIIGTKIVAELSDKYSVHSFVLISTDKAVNPSSIMGATKRAAEIFCQTCNIFSATRFITVRFGNVLDSAGSVIPLFRSQIQKGGPVTVTHPDITRYFMTIPEASQLILQANTMINQGDIFVLDMGEPINITYLAEQMIKLSGKTVGKDIDIIYTGLRPGEKLFEELFHQQENICETSHGKIKQAKVRHYDWSLLLKITHQIEKACLENDEISLRKLLSKLVPEYAGHVLNGDASLTPTYTRKIIQSSLYT